jgi:cell cycle sensor histidine kinase DivJ
VTLSAETETAPGALAALSHEMRTPLTAIAGYAEAMQARAFGPLSDKYAECAAVIGAATAHLLALIEDMAFLARVEEGRWQARPERLDARAAAEAALRLFALEAERKGVALSADLPAGALAIRADARALRQIMFNLIANALAAASCGGRVTLRLAAEAGELALAVEDDGPGPAGAGAFGEGVGLRLATALARQHGGSLTLEAGAAGGARARARLPVLA